MLFFPYYIVSNVVAFIRHAPPPLIQPYTSLVVMVMLFILIISRHRWSGRITGHILLMLLLSYTVRVIVLYQDVTTSVGVYILTIFLASVLLPPLSAVIYGSISISVVIYLNHIMNICATQRCTEVILITIFSTVIAALTGSTVKGVIRQNQLITQKIIDYYENDKRLFSNLAHRLKTPLTILQMEIGQYASKTKTAELEKITTDLKTAINELTRLSKVNLSQMSDARAQVNLVELLQGVARDGEILAKNYQHIKNKSRKVTLNIPPLKRPVYISANAEQLKEALLNLVDNSISHNDQKKSLTVNITLDIQPGYYHVAIKDDGVGIPPEQLKDILNKRSPKSKSSGYQHIGLAIVRNIIQSHQGDFSIFSTNQGTTVKVTLPAN